MSAISSKFEVQAAMILNGSSNGPRVLIALFPSRWVSEAVSEKLQTSNYLFLSYMCRAVPTQSHPQQFSIHMAMACRRLPHGAYFHMLVCEGRASPRCSSHQRRARALYLSFSHATGAAHRDHAEQQHVLILNRSRPTRSQGAQ